MSVEGSRIFGLQRPEGTNPATRSRILKVRVVRGKQLMRKDIFGTSDPYVNITLREGSHTDPYSYGKVSTRTVKNSLNPEWNQEYLFRVRPHDQRLLFEVYDQNRITRDDFLGQIELSLIQVKTEKDGVTIPPRKVNLKPRSSKSRVRGHLEVYLAYVVAEGWEGPQNEEEEEWDIVNTQEAIDTMGSETRSGANIPQSLTRPPPDNPSLGHFSGSTASISSPLPPNWEERTDSTGRVFYVNHQTRTTQWDRPVVGPTVENSNLLRNDRDQSFRAITEQASRMYEMRRHISHDDARGNRRPSELPSRSNSDAAVLDRSQALIDSADRGNTTPNISEEEQDFGDFAESVIGPLPSNWQIQKSAGGRIFFIDHNRRTTSWVDPRTGKPTPQASTLRPGQHAAVEPGRKHINELGPLPAGWEERTHSDGRVFFINHQAKKTQWDDPRLNDERIAGPAIPYSRDYKRKYEYFRSTLKAPTGIPNKFDIKVSRKSLMEDSFNAIMSVTSPEVMKAKLWIEFDGEVGLDYGGVSREFFYLLSRELFNPYYGLFEYSAIDSYTLQINPNSGLCNEQHLQWFRFTGRVIGLAMWHGKLMDAFFIRPFYKMMLQKPIQLSDMEAVDPEYYNSLKWILENDPEVLDLRFTVDEEILGATESFELKPGGEKIMVTSSNKKEYIDLVIKWRFVRRVEEQMKQFMSGFNEIIPQVLVQIFDPGELELLISGVSQIDVKDWRSNTNYKSGYHANHLVIQWFWRAVLSFDNEMRTRLLQFVTGTSRVPMNGFSELQGSNGPQKFTIEKWGDAVALPRAHTCFNRIDLPPYESFETLKEKLLLAIENTEGFGGVD